MPKNKFASAIILASTTLAAPASEVYYKEYNDALTFPQFVNVEEELRLDGTSINIFQSFHSTKDQERLNALFKFANEIMTDSIDTPSEYYEVIDENFWDLV
jgi:hypothetical protein